MPSPRLTLSSDTMIASMSAVSIVGQPGLKL